MRVRFEGGPLDGQMREIADGSRDVRVPMFPGLAGISMLSQLQADRFPFGEVVYEPAYVVFAICPQREVGP